MALLLWLNRDTTFFFDEMVWFEDLSTYTDPSSVLVPHNSHLHGTTRVVYWAVIGLFGPDYTIFRVLGAVVVSLAACLFFVLARRRIGAIPALVPAILLLFYGSAWQHVVGPIGFTVVGSAAAGLAALIALERDDRRGDLMACAFVCLSVFTFTVGLGFLVAAAISVLLRRDRFRRAWIFAVPLALYSTWWIWAQKFDQSRTTVANVDGVAEFFADSLAVVSGGLTGVNIPFTRFDELADVSVAPATTLGWIVAALVVIAVVWRLIRGDVSKSLYASMGVLFTYWLAAGLSEPIFFGSQADAIRYVYPGSIGVLLVVTDAARGLRIRGFALGALFAVGAFSLAMNLVFLRDGADYLRTEYSQSVRTRLAMLELGAGMQPGSPEGETGSADTSRLSPLIPYLVYGPDAEQYLAAIERYGSPAYSLDEIRSLPPELRNAADMAALQTTAYLRPRRSKGPSSRDGCERVVGGSTPIELSGAGAYLRARGTDPVTLSLVRFSDPPGAPLDPLSPGRWSRLELPPQPDRAAEPWALTAPEGAELQICPIL